MEFIWNHEERVSNKGDFLSNSDLFFYQIDHRARKAKFLKLSNSSFLKDLPFHFHWEIEKRVSTKNIIEIQLDELLFNYYKRNLEWKPLHFIYHMTLGGSTFLCRLLDKIDKVNTIKEPTPLSDMIDYLYYSKIQKPFLNYEWNKYLELVLFLYSKPILQSKINIIKPFCGVNLISHKIPLIVPNSKSVFLFKYLGPFMVSILSHKDRIKSIKSTLNMYTKYINNLSLANNSLFRFDSISHFNSKYINTLSPEDLIALYWTINISTYLSGTFDLNSRQSLLLNSDELMKNPIDILKKLIFNFKLETNKNWVDELLSSNVIDSNSKNSNIKFNAEKKVKQTNIAIDVYKENINRGTEFIKRFQQFTCSFEDQIYSRNLLI